MNKYIVYFMCLYIIYPGYTSPALIRFPIPPHATRPISMTRLGRFTPRLPREAPHLPRKLALILRAVMWIRQSHICTVYPHKHLGVLVFFPRRGGMIRMKFPRQLSVSPLDILGRGAPAYPQQFIQTLPFHVTGPRNRLCACRNLRCSHLEKPPKSYISGPVNRSFRQSLETHMTSAWRFIR